MRTYGLQIFPVCNFLIRTCNTLSWSPLCYFALVVCQSTVVGPIQAYAGNFNVYDIRKVRLAPPPAPRLIAQAQQTTSSFAANFAATCECQAHPAPGIDKTVGTSCA